MKILIFSPQIWLFQTSIFFPFENTIKSSYNHLDDCFVKYLCVHNLEKIVPYAAPLIYNWGILHPEFSDWRLAFNISENSFWL